MFLRYNWKEKGHILECNKEGPPWFLGGGGSGSNATDYVCDYDCIIIIPSKVKTKKFLRRGYFFVFAVCCQRVNGKTLLKAPSLGTHGYCYMLFKVLQV